MREIKFRAWDGYTKKLFNVAGIDFEYNEIYEQDSNKTTHGFDTCELMQYTGLHDKNGKEIYEGDVIKWLNHKIEIKWEEFGFVIPLGFRSSLEVIGNIHENPELLES